MAAKVNFLRKPWFTFFIFPVALGLVAAGIALLINPQLGERFGDQLYTSNKEITSYSYAVARASPSVVNIYVSRLNQDYTGISTETGEITTSASGVIMSPNGYIITNYHVIPSLNEPNRAVWVQTMDGKLRQAFIVGYDRRTDIAVLKINAQNLQAIPIDQNYTPRVGDVVLAIGNPNNLGLTVTHGIISATARTGSGLLTREMMNIREGLQDLIQTDAPINSGNSGGALVNTNGDLVGINTASFNNHRYGTYGIGFAIPTKLVVRVMHEILLHGRVIRGYLGISDENAELIANNNVNGVLVRYVDPLGPAAIAHIQEGDIIVQVDQKRIHNVRELIDVISSTSPGTELNITVERQGRRYIYPVTLAEDRPNID
ncbi:MAG TPA: trypsin-like peptidase domain-containing protein [Candidatus Anaerobiospirillum pullistercoris]|uniref:Trypsin-like peptidase domain-containing protein n=1 Tax=Candidatus Anaerobiospirillum pullistercoris TaxID=2838452 RepID=A0A9D1WEK6_9GAMM|nr:trypsin-like peptidase domain-containing protein [Candidatus Anaerobiospirillum pullistercoris]